MSKAFLRESDFDDTPDLPPVTSALPPGVKNYLTTAGAARLRAELDQLLATPRPALAAIAADPVAKAALRTRDLRIRHLQASLRTAEIVVPAAEPAGPVRFGSTVTVRDPAGEESTYQIVGVDEADPAVGRLSWQSPLARALHQARPGDRVSFPAPAGRRELVIVRVVNS